MKQKLTLDVNMSPRLRALADAMPIALKALEQINDSTGGGSLHDIAQAALDRIRPLAEVACSDTDSELEPAPIRYVREWIEKADPAVRSITIHADGPAADRYQTFGVTTERREAQFVR